MFGLRPANEVAHAGGCVDGTVRWRERAPRDGNLLGGNVVRVRGTWPMKFWYVDGLKLPGIEGSRKTNGARHF